MRRPVNLDDLEELKYSVQENEDFLVSAPH